MDNLELVWSTGSYIDSLQLHCGGIVVSGAINFQDLTLWLVKAGTDSVVDSKFSATPNKSGQFSLKYMPADGPFDLLVSKTSTSIKLGCSIRVIWISLKISARPLIRNLSKFPSL